MSLVCKPQVEIAKYSFDANAILISMNERNGDAEEIFELNCELKETDIFHL